MPAALHPLSLGLPGRRHALLRSLAVLAAGPSLGVLARAGPDECGLALARLQGGRLVEGASPACRAPDGGDAVFQAASLAKPVVATLALKRVQRGELDLDRPLSEMLPQGYPHRQNLFALRQAPVVDHVPVEVLRTMSVRHLLSHTAGLPHWADRGPLRLEGRPGERWRYSGEGYVLLQHLLQTLSGLPLQALAARELFEPLGLRRAAFRLTDALAPALVSGHAAQGQVRQLRFPYEIAASSLYVSAPDYARFMASLLADRALLALITSASVPVPQVPDLRWGLGWALERTAGREAIWHWGSNPGFRALAMADLGSRDAAVVLTASEDGMPQAKALVREHVPGRHPALDFSLVQ
ncbi:serine hydrolase domain-containing protein [Pelomonas sp. APW6]|uniref:Serine hydrolase domain-containing protein n=1 Tax=Roseateles subflavus TaxID=3053353 RepID=A0ABT7LIB4_9BURK|nr:serine hydrolase domain-containing protein [Pelomonas sp. APW6]MDL5032579.1 serine hydrolase domain-containing protein [Pelomonas sp. APW6]